MESLREAAKKIIGNAQPIKVSSLAQELNLSRPISLRTICSMADFYGKYIFRLENFKITNTRSRHEDTDYVYYTLKVGDEQPQSQMKSIGDVNNGTHGIDLEFGPITVKDPNTVVVFNYQIVNSGHSSEEVEQALKKGSDELLNPGTIQKIMEQGYALGGVWGVVIAGVVVGVAEVVNLLTGANCDGYVAVDEVLVTGATLKNWVSNSGSYSETRDYKGSDSPHGCGSNSKYYVTWSVRIAQ